MTYLVTVWRVQPVCCQVVITGHPEGQLLPPPCRALLRMAGTFFHLWRHKGWWQVLCGTELRTGCQAVPLPCLPDGAQDSLPADLCVSP